VLALFIVDTASKSPKTIAAIVGVGAVAVCLEFLWKWRRGAQSLQT